MPKTNSPRQRLLLWICALLLVALLYSKFLLTVGMIALLLLAFTDDQNGKLRPASRSLLKQRWRYFLSRKDFLVTTLFFFIVLLSGFYSADFGYWAERLRIKLPFLILPFAFASFSPLTSRQYSGLFYGFLLLLNLSTISVGLNYILNFESINQSIGMGKAIPTPINHIRYSLFLSFAVLSGLLLWWQKFYWKYPWERWVILGLSIYLFIFIHLLSVRSGLVVLYISSLLLGLRFIFYSRRYLLGSLLILGLCILPFAAYYTIPSLQQKIRYSLYDLDQYQKGNVSNLSDSERLLSIEAGLSLAKQSPLIGQGAGDLKMAVREYYKIKYPEISQPKLPHNQFVSVLAGTGILGLAIFLFALFFPLWYRSNYKDNYFVILHVILFFSFFVENTIENAIGVAFYSLFLGLGLNRRGTIDSPKTD